jgi:hypothetical protein
MRVLRSILLILLFCAAEPATAEAQRAANRRVVPIGITLSLPVPAEKPSLSPQGLLHQVGFGILGTIAGTVAGLPFVLSSSESDLGIAMFSLAFVAGTTAGIHYAGRKEGMSANPWATSAGVLGGLVVAGAMMQPSIDDEGTSEGAAPLLVFIMPSVGGTYGFAMTRRSR